MQVRYMRCVRVGPATASHLGWWDALAPTPGLWNKVQTNIALARRPLRDVTIENQLPGTIVRWCLTANPLRVEIDPGVSAGEYSPQVLLKPGPTAYGVFEEYTTQTSAARAQTRASVWDNIQPFKWIGIRVTTLDREVTKARGETTEEGQGRKFEFESVEPWHQPVDGALLLDELVAYYRRFLVLPEYAAEAIGLWSLHTYLLDVIYTTPYLAFLSPEKRCGKTRGLVALSFVCAKPLLNTSISPAALFRIIEKHAPTMLVDEFDTFLKNDELRGILNAGYTRDTAKVPRCVGDDHEPREFSVWGAKAFALIGKLPSTLEDRTIVIPMKRKLLNEKVDRLRSRCRDQVKPLRQKCVRFAADIRLQIQQAEPPLPEELNDRGQDIWEPLLAIADVAGGNWPKRARQAAVALSGGDGADDDSFNVQLLADIRKVFTVKPYDRIPTVELIDALIGMEERPWGEANRGKPITARWLAAKLKLFGIVRGTKRSGGSTFKGYTLAQFVDVFQRYVVSNRSQGHNVETARVSEEFKEVTNQSCDLFENGLEANKDGGCDPVTFSDGENEAVDETKPRSWRVRI